MQCKRDIFFLMKVSAEFMKTLIFLFLFYLHPGNAAHSDGDQSCTGLFDVVCTDITCDVVNRTKNIIDDVDHEDKHLCCQCPAGTYMSKICQKGRFHSRTCTPCEFVVGDPTRQSFTNETLHSHRECTRALQHCTQGFVRIEGNTTHDTTCVEASQDVAQLTSSTLSHSTSSTTLQTIPLPTPASQGLSNGVIIALVVLVVVVIVAAVVALCCWLKRRRTQNGNQPSNGGEEGLMLGGGVGSDGGGGGSASNRLPHPTSDLCGSQDSECNRSAPKIHKENARVKKMENDTDGSSNNATEEDTAEHARLLNPSPESAPSMRRDRSENSTEEPDHGRLESPHPTQASGKQSPNGGLEPSPPDERVSTVGEGSGKTTSAGLNRTEEGPEHDESCPLLDATSQSGNSSSNRGERPNNNKTPTVTNVPPNNDVDEDGDQRTYRPDTRQAKAGVLAADKTVSTDEEAYAEEASSSKTSANASGKDVPSTSSTIKKEKKPQTKIFLELEPEKRLSIIKSIWEILLEHLNRSKIKRLLRLYRITEGEIGNLKAKEEDWHDFCACAYNMLKPKKEFTPRNLIAKFITMGDQTCVDFIEEYCKREGIVDDEQTSS
ncbi:uncharacterized protein LOC143462994 isoform X2 [Clavelina lepadiformis]|uniref:uncharacterized protein LOC143462994 isoform X2 n=1 Tax=Clavelina lepadiformis TaxID=159417 RepID=UPI0040422474